VNLREFTEVTSAITLRYDERVRDINERWAKEIAIAREEFHQELSSAVAQLRGDEEPLRAAEERIDARARLASR
jgi:hypothetical protein